MKDGVRFISALNMRWHGGHFTGNISVEEAGENIDSGTVARLFMFEAGGTVIRLTDWEDDIFTDNNWRHAAIECGPIRNSLKLQNERTNLKVSLDDIEPLNGMILGELMLPLKVTIMNYFFIDGSSSVIFFGRTGKVSSSGKSLELELNLAAGALDRIVPRQQFSLTCNHFFCGNGCGLNSVNYKKEGLVSSQNGNTLLLSGFTLTTAEQEADYFADGWAKIEGLKREIISSTGMEITLSHSFPAPVGKVIEIMAGCDGNYSTCISKFGNGARFGGFPFLPEWIEQAPSGMPKAGK